MSGTPHRAPPRWPTRSAGLWDRWEEDGAFRPQPRWAPGRNPIRSPAGRSSSSSTCSPTPGRGLPASAIRSAASRPTSMAATSGCVDATSSTSSATTLSVCRRSSMPSRPDPRKTTEDNILNMRRQLRRLGLAHDDRRSVATTDPEFYRWTQWIFLQIFNAWFDAEADGGVGRARPIQDLIDAYAAGSRPRPTVAPGRTSPQPSRRRSSTPTGSPMSPKHRSTGVPVTGHGAGQRGGHRRGAAPTSTTSPSSGATCANG